MILDIEQEQRLVESITECGLENWGMRDWEIEELIDDADDLEDLLEKLLEEK